MIYDYNVFRKRGLIMLKNRDVVHDFLDKKCMEIIFNQEKCLELYDFCYLNYNVPKSLTADLVAGRKTFAEVSEFCLFILIKGFDEIYNKNNIGLFYTEQEIKAYLSAKYEIAGSKFPIEFNVIQVTPNQWIGSIDVQSLMKLRNAQLINYNENAQRALQKVIKGDKEFFKIQINKKAVNDIVDSLKSEMYIPDDLTLNIPEEDIENDFVFDPRTNRLVIKNIKHFDMTDGYHRYLSLCRLYDLNNEFNYNMELRITNFSEEKARQFIWQKDQKTKMRKIDSESFNTVNPGNIVASKINESSKCNIQGMVTQKGNYNYAYVAAWINYLFFPAKLGKADSKLLILEVTKDFIESFNLLTEEDNQYLTMSFDYKTIAIIMTIFSLYFKKDKANLIQTINYVRNQLINETDLFINKTPRRAVFNKIKSIVEGVN